MQGMTLEELKAENAKAEEQASLEQPQEGEEVPTVEAAETESEEGQEVAEPESQESDEADVESWMQGDDESPQEDEEQTVPLKAHIRQREKLKGKNSELEEKVKKLEAMLEQGGNNNAAQAAPTAPPKLEDFAYDEGKYHAAMNDYYANTIQSQIAKSQQTAAQQAQLQQRQSQIEGSVNRHYERAEKLIKQNGIKPDAFKEAELQFRQSLDTLFPGEGDQTADGLIDVLGEGSEKFIYAAWKKPALMQQFLTEMQANTHKAVAFASRKTAEFNKPARTKSNAPPPARQINGDTVKTTDAYKSYKEAKQKGDDNTAINMKLDAKRAGVDVSKW